MIKYYVPGFRLRIESFEYSRHAHTGRKEAQVEGDIAAPKVAKLMRDDASLVRRPHQADRHMRIRK